MKHTLLLLLFSTLLVPPAAGHSIRIDEQEVPLVIDTYGRYRQNQSLFYWTPFDSTRQVWDLTRYPGGLRARVGLRDYTEGRYPAPDSMENDPPDPYVCEFDTLGDNSESEVYLYLNEFGLYADGIDFTQQTFRFLGNYRPDGVVYALPMYYGASWITAWSWQYEIIPGIPYQATEQHQKRIVGRGKVKIPMSGEYFWPCLVIQDNMVYNDNMGTNQRRWIYEWVVPGHFCGGNGVAAALSQNGASPDFVTVETFLQLDTLSIPGWDLYPPRFGATTILTDTGYPGPFVVSSTIIDNQAVGTESLFYRINLGTWVSVPADSQRGNLYYFTIPQVTPPARIDYYIWAMDEFCVDNEIEFWTTFPFCSPESTMLTFNVHTVGTTEERPLPPAAAGEFSVSPNPAKNAVRFSLRQPCCRTARVDIYRIDGTVVRTLYLKPEGEGVLSASLRTDRLAPGTYFYRISANRFSQTGRLTVAR